MTKLHHPKKHCQLPDLFDWAAEQDRRVAATVSDGYRVTAGFLSPLQQP